LKASTCLLISASAAGTLSLICCRKPKQVLQPTRLCALQTTLPPFRSFHLFVTVICSLSPRSLMPKSVSTSHSSGVSSSSICMADNASSSSSSSSSKIAAVCGERSIKPS
jgi:hypothetical protein